MLLQDLLSFTEITVINLYFLALLIMGPKKGGRGMTFQSALKNKKKPTGDPDCPEEVRRAKRIDRAIQQKIGVEDFDDDEEEDDDEMNAFEYEEQCQEEEYFHCSSQTCACLRRAVLSQTCTCHVVSFSYHKSDSEQQQTFINK